MIETMNTKSKFVVLASPRSGSSHIVSLLNSHPEINCMGEIFNPNGAVLKDLGLKNKKAAKRVGEAPLEFLQQVIDTVGTGDECKPVFGMKLMLHHDPRVMNHILEDADWKVIVLDRGDRLEQWTSLRLAKESGRWDTNKGKKKPAALEQELGTQPPVQVNDKLEDVKLKAKITFMPKKFEQYSFRMAAKYNSVYDRLGNRRYMKVLAEDIDLRHQEILEFLEVDASAAGPVSSERQNPRSMRDRIENYDDFVKYARKHSLQYRE